MTEHADRMRALERLRAVETDLSVRVEALRRWVAIDLTTQASAAGLDEPPRPPAETLRNELWWREPAPGGSVGADRETLDRIGVLADWLRGFDRTLMGAGTTKNAYAPNRGDGSPLDAILGPLFEGLTEAARLRAVAGIQPT